MTSIKCYFEVIGHGFDPAVLTEALGIEPSETWRTGDTTRRSGRPYKHDGWSLVSDEVASLDLQEVALPILRKMLPVAASLVECCGRLKLEAFLSCTVYVEDNQMAAISLDRDAVGMLSELGASLDIDILDLGRSADDSSA